MRGKVVNKHARHNLCFGDVDQISDYENGNGTIIAFEKLICLNHIRKHLHILLNDKAYNLNGEANYYYDLKKCGIGYHGDAERKIVVGMR